MNPLPTPAPCRPRRLACLALLALGGLLPVGCGGQGSSSSGGAQAFVTINWPSTTGRLIPLGADSVVVSFAASGSVVATQTAARMTGETSTTLAFLGLPTGALIMKAVAHPNSDGSGAVQATGAATVTLASGEVRNVTVSLATGVDHLLVSPSTATLAIGATTTLGVTGVDSAGGMVLLGRSAVSWTSAAGSVASVSAAGVVTAVAPGTAVVTATDGDSGKSGTATLTVSPPPSVTISPASATLSILGQQTFAATVTNASNTKVTWSVKEGSAGGTITTAGAYTAPATPGTYHVVATSQADTTKSATAEVVVQAGGSNVTVS